MGIMRFAFFQALFDTWLKSAVQELCTVVICTKLVSEAVAPLRKPAVRVRQAIRSKRERLMITRERSQLSAVQLRFLDKGLGPVRCSLPSTPMDIIGSSLGTEGAQHLACSFSKAWCGLGWKDVMLACISKSSVDKGTAFNTH